MDFVSDSGRRQGPGLARTQHYSHYLSLEGGGHTKGGYPPTGLHLGQCVLPKGYTD